MISEPGPLDETGVLAWAIATDKSASISGHDISAADDSRTKRVRLPSSSFFGSAAPAHGFPRGADQRLVVRVELVDESVQLLLCGRSRRPSLRPGSRGQVPYGCIESDAVYCRLSCQETP
jgi:hypothetical protein